METIIMEQIARQQLFSATTFGPRDDYGNPDGLVDHIRKEISEIREEPSDLEEWIDLIMLSTDGFWRMTGQRNNPGGCLDRLRRGVLFHYLSTPIDDVESVLSTYERILGPIADMECHRSSVQWDALCNLAVAGAATFAVTEYDDPFESIMDMLAFKQEKNENRKWPDWRTVEPGKAIEHIRDDPEKLMDTTLAENLFSMQPMTPPQGKIFSLKHKSLEDDE